MATRIHSFTQYGRSGRSRDGHCNHFFGLAGGCARSLVAVALATPPLRRVLGERSKPVLVEASPVPACKSLLALGATCHDPLQSLKECAL
jgi:hypothetical protein